MAVPTPLPGGLDHVARLAPVNAPAWLDVLDATIAACDSGRRSDLSGRLSQQRERLLDPRLRVVVAGHRNHGKSRLINALLDARVCAVGDGVTTPVPTRLSHAETAGATVVTAPQNLPVPAVGPSGAGETRVPVPVSSLRDLTGGGSPEASPLPPGRARGVEIGLPNELLAAGFVLIDTPAITGELPRREMPAYAALDGADVLVLTSDVTMDLSPADEALLAQATRTGRNAALALTKIDLTSGWREAAERVGNRLATEGLPAALLPLAAPLRTRAAREGDRRGNVESGFPAMIDWLRAQAESKRDGAAAAAANAAATALGELATPLRAEICRHGAGGNDDPEAATGEAQRRVERLRRVSSRCQTLLGDEMADLLADVEHDLRLRTRRILHEVERVFERADPSSGWDEFAEWLRDAVSDAAHATFTWLLDRASWVADRVAEEFPLPPDRPDALTLDLPSEAAECSAELERPHLERFGIGQMAFTGMRGSYGGVLMFGLMTSLAGLPLVNPVSLGAGAAFAGKSIHDESESRLRRRQLAARGAAQRYVDDFFIRFSKHLRDVGKDVHRTLRDRLTALTEETQDAITAAASAARADAASRAAERDRLAARARGQLQQLVVLHGKARAIAGSVR